MKHVELASVHFASYWNAFLFFVFAKFWTAVSAKDSKIVMLYIQLHVSNVQQESIPVGCVPPAFLVREGVCPPPPRGQINTCENITLPQTLFAGGENVLLY